MYHCITTLNWGDMFHIRAESGEPIYIQLIRQIKNAVASGILNPGDQMPTVRELATQLVVNPNTVARAYRELIRESVLKAQQGQNGGTFVKMEPQPLFQVEREKRLKPFIEQLVAEAQILGISDENLLRQVNKAVNKAAAGRNKIEKSN
jgi:GntR family transcriptional regulator